jgi:hypothetical protein
MAQPHYYRFVIILRLSEAAYFSQYKLKGKVFPDEALKAYSGEVQP